MTEAALQTEIATFERDVDQYRNTCGPSWVVVVGAEAKGHFSEFDAAARFAIGNYPEIDVLIRHTDPEPEFLPLIAVCDVGARRGRGPRN